MRTRWLLWKASWVTSFGTQVSWMCWIVTIRRQTFCYLNLPVTLISGQKIWLHDHERYFWAAKLAIKRVNYYYYYYYLFIFNNIYSINNQQSKILTNTTILTLLTIQYLEYNRLRYLLCLQCKDLQYSVLTTLPTHYSHYNALFTSSSN